MLQSPHYFESAGATFEERVAGLFSQLAPDVVPARLVFFDDVPDDATYERRLEVLAKVVTTRFSNKAPVFSYIAQPPLPPGNMVMEVTLFDGSGADNIRYERLGNHTYLVMETPDARWLLLGGMRSGRPDAPMREQSDALFKAIAAIFNREGFSPEAITRQWNYIEQIDDTSSGLQNYQCFNDARSDFYAGAIWHNGYPAATGIGISCSGLVVDLEAIQPRNKSVSIYSLNNSLQVPAHAYSPCVLFVPQHADQSATPKFERAKLLTFAESGLMHISGTAAIRGEVSHTEDDVVEQTQITLENMQHLFDRQTLMTAGLSDTSEEMFRSLRVYLRHDWHYKSVKSVVQQALPDVPAVYLQADICRRELLVEIEGVGSLRVCPKILTEK